GALTSAMCSQAPVGSRAWRAAECLFGLLLDGSVVRPDRWSMFGCRAPAPWSVPLLPESQGQRDHSGDRDDSADDGDDCMEVHHFTSDPSLQRRSSRRLRSHALALRLGQAIRHSWWEAYPLSRSLENPPVGEPRAIDVDAVLADSVEWMSATRMVLTDIVHDFGLLEVLRINEDGSLNTRWWQPQMLDGWKAVAAVPKTDREILLSP